MTGGSQVVLSVESYGMVLGPPRARRTVLGDVSFTVAQGQALGLVGESGSGKSLTARSTLRLLPRTAETTGDIKVNGRSVLSMSRKDLGRLRRETVALIHQDPRAAMNPMHTIGDFLTEGIRHLPKEERLRRAVDALDEVGIPDGERRCRQYPHQLSGGLLQRVVIAACIIPSPDLIVADEPTTALDVTSQSEVMAVLRDEQRHRGMAMLFITHDLDLAAAVTDQLTVMYAGAIVEHGPSTELLSAPRHPYTAALIAARPSTTKVSRLRSIPGTALSGGEAGTGCVFAPRCPYAVERCWMTRPLLSSVDGRTVACHRADELPSDLVEGWEQVVMP